MTTTAEAKQDGKGRVRWERDDDDKWVWPAPDPTDAPHSVAIVGKGKSRTRAPWGVRGWEIWGLNEANEWWQSDTIPPLHCHTRWFQLHPPRYLKKHYQPGIDDLNLSWTRDRGVRMYMDKHYRVYPNSEPYPKAEVEALTKHGHYHASSFDWMLALAILEGFRTVHLFGCGFTTFPYLNGEPISARACLEYWIGVAEGRGCEVTLHDEGDTLKIVHLAKMTSELQYGWDREPGLEAKQYGWIDVR